MSSSSSAAVAPPREEYPPEDPICDECECKPCDSTSKPVRYFNGEVVLSERDLVSAVPGFGHGRSYSNKLANNYEGPNGNNWLMPDWPYLVPEPSDPDPPSVFVFVRGQERVWFDRSGSTYTARNAQDATYTLAPDGTDPLLILTKKTPTGVETIRFHDFESTTHHKGMLHEHLDAYGNKTAASYAEDTDRWIEELVYTVDGQDEAYSILYDYYSPGAHTDRIEIATLRKTEDVTPPEDDPIVWSDVRRVTYDYYGADEDYGNPNDLKLVSVQEPDGGGGWEDPVSFSYYRYYLSGEGNGFIGALKYAVGPAAYAEMLEADLDPEVDDVATYADHYFEYDATRRVTKEIARNCTSCGGGGGTGSDGEEFLRRDNTNGGYTDGYNNWKWQVTLTKANGNVEVVYTNYLGQVILRELKASDSPSADAWVTYTEYGESSHDAGKVVKRASPAAVQTYTRPVSPAVIPPNDLGVTLRTGAGLVTYNTYYDTTGSGAVEGYLQKVEIREGDDADGGTYPLIPQRDLTYTKNGSVVRVASETVYSDTTGSNAITTSYAYTWHSGTVPSVKQITTTLPDTSSQHGTTATTRQYFDANGRLTFSQDARDVITKHTYNEVTGRRVQTQVDVDSTTTPSVGLPTGWTGAGSTNLITNYEYDNLGRQTQMLGPVHPADVGGSSTSVRHATWTVYVEGAMSDQTWTGRGYHVEGGSDFLVNPVSIVEADKNGRPTNQVRAKRTSGSGALSSGDEFLYTGWSRWTVSFYDKTGRLDYQRAYHDLPAQDPDTGINTSDDTPLRELDPGLEGTNYAETSYEYDNATNQRVAMISPDKTITRTVYDGIKRPIGTWVGTDDTGATADDPTGGGATGNNMVQVSQSVYDGGTSGGGDSFLTKTVLNVNGNSSHDRETNYTYDFRGRRLTVDGEEDLFVKNTYDNLSRLTVVERYDTSESASNLVGKQETSFDNRGRVYETKTYEVDPTNGDIGTHLTGDNWHDANGNLTKSVAPGSGEVWTKNTYDNIGRRTRSYTGYDDSGDVIVQDSLTTYNEASQATKGQLKQLDTGVNPASSQTYRSTYRAMFYDGAGRSIGQANYGTADPGSPVVVPSRSDTVLVNSTAYDADTGEVESTTDPGGIVTGREYDVMGRVTKQIDNVQASGTADDINRTTLYTYTADSQQATVTAVLDLTDPTNPTKNEVTTYVYGVQVSSGSSLAANNLLYQTRYPTDGSSEGIYLAYNRQGQVTKRIDQNGTLHEYEYDLLGRPIADIADNLGTGIDDAVLRLTRSYNNRGLPEFLTSWSTATGTSAGGIVNQVELAYNDFGQLADDWQDHDGAVEHSGGNQTLRVQYGYAPGIVSTIPTNQVRPVSMTYPNGRQLDYAYGGENGLNDNLNRISQVQEDVSGTKTWVSYKHLGLGTKVVADYEEVDVRWELWDSTNGYTGLDAFNRLDRVYWHKYGSGATDLVDLAYGYNRNSLPTYREDNSPNASDNFDELYDRDGLDRLDDYTRGGLNGAKDAIPTADATFRQLWGLDQVANWESMDQDNTGDGSSAWTYETTRTHNFVNEITDIDDAGVTTWTDPVYDDAGNTTTMPNGLTPNSSFTATYDAWNRLVKADFGDGVSYEYAYDARGFRMTETKNDSGVEWVRHFYYTSEWQCIEERYQDQSSGGGSAPINLSRQYVWGLRYIDDLVQRQRDTSGTGLDETLYALNDRQFNVVALVNTAGGVEQRMVTTPYGQTAFLTASYGTTTNTKDWRHLFQGLRLDYGTSLIENRNRVLHPLLGRFLQRDPLGYSDGMNVYAAYHVLWGYTDSFGKEIDAGTEMPEEIGGRSPHDIARKATQVGGKVGVPCYKEAVQAAQSANALMNKTGCRCFGAVLLQSIDQVDAIWVWRGISGPALHPTDEDPEMSRGLRKWRQAIRVIATYNCVVVCLYDYGSAPGLIGSFFDLMKTVDDAADAADDPFDGQKPAQIRDSVFLKLEADIYTVGTVQMTLYTSPLRGRSEESRDYFDRLYGKTPLDIDNFPGQVHISNAKSETEIDHWKRPTD